MIKWIALGVIVGLVLSLSFNLPFLLTAVQVAAGELLAVIIGLALIKAQERVDLTKYTD